VPIRRAVGSAILLVAVLAVTLFAVPLAVAASRLYRDQTSDQLAGEAVRAAAKIRQGTGRVTLPTPRRPGVQLAAYAGSGQRVAGVGPARSGAVVAVAADGAEHEELSGGQLAVAVPVETGRQDLIVRAAVSYDTVLARTWVTIGGMSLLAVAVVALAAVVARRRAARIAAPLEELTRAADALGAGDFTVRAGGSSILEAEQAGRALARTARRLGALLDRERALTSDISHQIRTPLTALRLGLERAALDPGRDPAVAFRAALDRIDRVEATVTELLASARDTLAPVEPTDLAALVEQARDQRWRELAGSRELHTRFEPGLPPAAATSAVLHQVLDVLVNNALEHGAGPVTVSVRAVAEALAVEVSDQGAGFDETALAAAFRRGDPRARGHGIGLPLARDLTESIGGRLTVSHPGPAPVVTVLLNAWPPPRAYSDRA
jgi:signal transduction histidine kinase